jgi:hypothetical protein
MINHIQDAVNSATAANSIVLTFPSPPTNGDTLFLEVFLGAGTPPVISQSGVSWVLERNSTAYFHRFRSFKVSGASQTITITDPSNTNSYMQGIAREFSGNPNFLDRFASMNGGPGPADTGSTLQTRSPSELWLADWWWNPTGSGAGNSPTNGFVGLVQTQGMFNPSDFIDFAAAYNIVNSTGIAESQLTLPGTISQWEASMLTYATSPIPTVIDLVQYASNKAEYSGSNISGLNIPLVNNPIPGDVLFLLVGDANEVTSVSSNGTGVWNQIEMDAFLQLAIWKGTKISASDNIVSITKTSNSNAIGGIVAEFTGSPTAVDQVNNNDVSIGASFSLQTINGLSGTITQTRFPNELWLAGLQAVSFKKNSTFGYNGTLANSFVQIATLSYREGTDPNDSADLLLGYFVSNSIGSVSTQQSFTGQYPSGGDIAGVVAALYSPIGDPLLFGMEV